MKKLMDNRIELPGILGEYISLGEELGLFKNNINAITARLSGTVIEYDDTLEETSKISYKNGIYTITINKSNLSDRTVDSIIFHDLTHISNEIYRDLYVYQSSQIMRLKNENSETPVEYGMLMLEGSVCNYISDLMVEKKYNLESYTEIGRGYSIDVIRRLIATGATNHPDGYTFQELFAQTIYKKEPLFNLCKDCMEDLFIDKMIWKYKNRENGIRELCYILGHLGNIKIGSTRMGASDPKYSKTLVYQSMNEVVNKTEKIVEEQ